MKVTMESAFVALDGSKGRCPAWMRILFVTFVVASSLTTSLPASPSSLPYAWKATYGGVGPGSETLQAMAVHGSRVYVTGHSGLTSLEQDYLTVAYDVGGPPELWARAYDGPAGSYDVARALTVDPLGNVLVTGTSDGGSTSWDFATIKYDSSGNQLWVKRYDGPAHEGDEAIAIAVSSGTSADVYVTGWSKGSRTNYDYATVKYDASGNQVWVSRESGGLSSGDDFPVGLAIGLGAVTVTGTSEQRGIVTVQYSAADGGLLWGDGLAGKAVGIAGDESTKSVYVTGTSEGQGTKDDILVIGYPAGGPKWVKRYDGFSSGIFAKAQAIALRGDAIYVLGTSSSDGSLVGDSDAVLLKYDRNDTSSGYGKELWSRRLDAAYAEQARGMAVDPNGNIHVTATAFVPYFHFLILTQSYSPSGQAIGPYGCLIGISSELTPSWPLPCGADSGGNTYLGSTVAAALYNETEFMVLKYKLPLDVMISSGAFYKIESGSTRFHAPVDMEGSMEIQLFEPKAFPESSASAVTAFDLRAKSGEGFRLRYPPPREDPVLAATSGLAPASFLLSSRRDRAAQAWLVLEGPSADLERGFQGYCILPQPEVPDGVYSGDQEHPASLEFSKSTSRGFPPGLGVYQYRVRCPESEGTTGCEVDLKLYGILTLQAKRVGPPAAAPDCVRPSDYFPRSQQGLETAVLGPVSTVAAKEGAAKPHPLEIADSDGDSLLDLIVPWSRQGASRPFTLDFAQVCGPTLPSSVTIHFTTLGDDVLWEAHRAGAVVGSQVSVTKPQPQTVTFTPAQGLDTITISEGFEVSIHEICWQCPPPVPACGVSRFTAEARADGISGSCRLTGELNGRDPRGPALVALIGADGEPVDLGDRVQIRKGELDPTLQFEINAPCADLLPEGEGILCLASLCANGFYGADCVPVRCPGASAFQRGDCNGDKGHDISDAVFGLSFLFLGAQDPQCRQACDVNADGSLDLSDSVAMLGYIFLGSPPPRFPFPECGADPGGTVELGCEADSCR